MDPLDVKDTVEKSAQQAVQNARLMRVIAILTSIFALMAAVSGLMSARCTTRGLVAKNEAIYWQGMITDEWSYFQSRNIRLELLEVVKKINPTKFDERDTANYERFKREADDLHAKAKAKEAERDQWNRKSAAYLDVSKTFASAMTLLQVAVVLVPLNVIMNGIMLLMTGSLMGFVGMGYLALSYIEYFRVLQLFP